MEMSPRGLIDFWQRVRRHNPVRPLSPDHKRPVVLFYVVLLVSACCKLFALHSRELWLDETYSAFMANLPFPELLRHATGDVHPPLFYMLLWAWVRIVGGAEAQLRLFSVVLNICSTVGMYVLARRILGARFGTVAAALFAFSPMLFVYSMEVRNYMLFTLVFVCLLIVHWAIAVQRKEEKWLVVAYGALAALLFYVNYVGVFVLLGLFVHWMIISGFVRGRLVRLCAAGVLTVALVSPGIPGLLDRHSSKGRLDQALTLSHQNPEALSYGVTRQGSAELARTEIKGVADDAAAAAGFYPFTSILLLLLCAAPLAVALLGVGFLWFVRDDEVCRLFGILLLAVGIGLALLHLYATRYMLPLVPPLALAVARAIQYGTERPRWRVPSLAVGTLILCFYAAGFFRQEFKPHGRPWQNLVSAVQQNYSPGDRVIFDALYAQVPFDYFARNLNFHPQETGFPISVYDWWDRQEIKAWGGPVIMRADLDQFISVVSTSRPRTLWLVLYEFDVYDAHRALLERLGQLGQATEVSLPPDPDNGDSQGNPPLRLIRISLK